MLSMVQTQATQTAYTAKAIMFALLAMSVHKTYLPMRRLTLFLAILFLHPKIHFIQTVNLDVSRVTTLMDLKCQSFLDMILEKT